MVESVTAGQWAVLALAAVVIGVAKGGFGGSIAILAVPLTAWALPADRAVGVMLPVLMFADVLAGLRHFKARDRRVMPALVVGAVAGIAAGAGLVLVLREVADLGRSLSLIVGLICLVMVVVQAARVMRGARTAAAAGVASGVASGVEGARGSALVGGGVGVLTGLTSTLAHAAGPVAGLYLLQRGLSKAAYAGTMVSLFFVVNWLKVPAYLGLGLITWETLAVSGVMAIAVPAGIGLGIWLHGRVPERPFMLIVYAASLGAAGRMVWQGLA